MKLKNLKPEKIFRYFEEISNVPRESHHEEKIAEYIMNFAKKHNLEYMQEECGNVVIKKPASKGYENYQSIVLQVHMDMVCVKKEGYEHNFFNDPLDMVVEDGFIKANNTSLGADDGIGMAIVLCILENNELKHSDLTALFTVCEETTMFGAMQTNPKNLAFGNKKIAAVINVDSENEGTLCVGSAGTLTHNLEKTIVWEQNSYKNAFIISIKDLMGGHSGIDIHKCTANAIKLMVRVLDNIKSDYRLFYFDAGEKQNAIPNYAKVKITTDLSKDELDNNIKDILDKIKIDYKEIEPNIKIFAEYEKKPKKVFSYNVQDELLAMILSITTGVISMNEKNPNLVETSNNLATVRMVDEKILIENCIRSMYKIKMQNVSAIIRIIADQLNFTSIFGGEVLPWNHKPNTKLENTMKKVYRELFNKEMKVEELHAGIESSELFLIMPNSEHISIGPDVINPHTCYEKIKIDSCPKVLKFLEKTLEELIYE